MKTTHKLFAALLLNILLWTSMAAGAAVPQTLSYQGQLTTAAGAPVNGTVSVVFSLYDVASGVTAPLWTETQSVTVTNGLFNVVLGATPITLAFDVPYYLGIKVGTDAEMTPRQAMTSVGSALRANYASDANMLVGHSASEFALASQLTEYVTSTQLASQLAGLAAGPQGATGATGPQGPAGAGGSLAPGSTAPRSTTLTAVDTVGDVGADTSITVGTDGFPVISYFDATNFDLKVAHCSDAACTASTLTAVDTGGSVGRFTSITIGTDGFPVISYWDATNFDLKVAHCSNAACTASTLTAVDTVGDVGYYTSITVGTDGFPVISYYDITNGDLKVAHCGDAACTASTRTAVDTTFGDVGQYTSITVGIDGFPVISYFDWTNADLKVAHCSDAACTANNTLTAVDTGGVVGEFTSITVGIDGFPVISYYDITNGDLKVAHCGDAACTASTRTAVDTTVGDVGQYTSITVGIDGFPVISYRHGLNGDLKVAHCGDAACTANNTLTAVDTGGVVGEFTSITVGTDGFPVISYYDFTNADLKVAKCLNVSCFNNWVRR